MNLKELTIYTNNETSGVSMLPTSQLRAMINIIKAAKDIYDTSVNHVTSEQTLCYKGKYFRQLEKALTQLDQDKKE